MTVAFGAIGAKSAGGTTTTNVDHPASVGAGDLEILGDVGWLSAAGVNAISGWTVAQRAGGTGTAVDAHTTTVAAFYKQAAGGETGTVAVGRGGTPTGQLGVMCRYTPSTGAWDSIVQASGTDNTHGTNRSISTTTKVPLAPGDMLNLAWAVDTDTSLTVSCGVSAPGITFSTPVRRTTGAGVTTGEDGNVEVFDTTVLTGTATVTVTATLTTATSQCGGCVITRMRETPGGTDATVNAVPATATAATVNPTVTAERNATVDAVVAEATAAAIAPVVGVVTNATVNAVAATATASAPAHVVTGVRNATVTAVAATATAATPNPVVTGVRNATVVAVVALATAACGTPAVSSGSTVTPPPATATAAALPPAVSAGGSVTVTAVAATATATGRVPVVSATRSATVVQVKASATAAALPPVVTASRSATVSPPRAQATALALAPVVTATRSATVLATTALADATALPPDVSGSTAVLVIAYRFDGAVLVPLLPPVKA